MTSPIRFVPLASRDAKISQDLSKWSEPLWFRYYHAMIFLSTHGTFKVSEQRGITARLSIFQLDVKSTSYYPKNSRNLSLPAKIPEELLMREPFLSFAKVNYLQLRTKKFNSIKTKSFALRYSHLERALFELNGCTCPTATTPEVLNRACNLITDRVGKAQSSLMGKTLEFFYRQMVELELMAVPSSWSSIIPPPAQTFNRIGQEFDRKRQQKLPSPLAIEAMAEIFNSDSEDPLEIFSSSICALMLCSPDRSIEMLYAPRDILTPDWIDEKTGEAGTGLRWFPAKGARPMVKTIIPSMRDIAVRAAERLRQLSAPAQKLAKWYEKNPNRVYLPPHLEYLRSHLRIDQTEIHAILFSGVVKNQQQQRVKDASLG